MRVIAHDLNGPLTGMNLTLQALRRLKTLPAAQPMIDALDRDLRQASDLLEELKSLNRRDTYRLNALDLTHEITQFVEQLRASTAGTLLVEFSPIAGSLIVAGDVSRLRRVWQNIARNAVEAAELAKRSEKARLMITARRTGNFARLQFSDNAGGIKKKQLQRAFEPFYTTKGKNNRGLGLFISRKITTEHNGKIRIVSRKPYTRVTVDLPILP